MSIKEIANQHVRSIGAISARQNHIARRLVNSGEFAIEEAARVVRKPVCEIVRSVNVSKKIKYSITEKHVDKEETLLSVMIDVRSLLKQMVANQNKIIQDMKD
jgi:hypothetical protein